MNRPFAPEKADGVLEGLLDEISRLRSEGRIPLVVFDVDDTLLSTSQRQLRILREFSASNPAASSRLAGVEAGGLRYAITETARAAGFDDPDGLSELREFWSGRFFANDYLLEDEPIPGAPEFCRAALERGGVVVYMTGRDESMREGTLAAFAKHGFPLPDAGRVFLMLKPRFDTPDLEYKSLCLSRLREVDSVAGGFENEPAHVNMFFEAFPKARMVFVDTRHSGKPVAPRPGIPWIKDFRRG